MKRRDFLKASMATGAGLALTGAPGVLKYALGETPVKFGVMLPLSGVLAELSADQKLATEIAVEEINAKGGILGRKLEMILRDSETDAKTARRKGIELLDRQKVDFIGGCCTGWEELTLNDLSKKRGVLFLVFPQNIIDNKKHFNKYGFCLANVTPYQAASAAGKWVAENLPGKKWHLLADHYSWPKMWLPAFKKWAQKSGKQWTGETWSPFPCTDYSPYIPQILASKPDVLFTVTWGSGQISQIKQLHEFGLYKKLPVMFGVSDVPWAHAAGAGTFEGMYAGMPWYWKLQDKYPKAKAFNKKFWERGKRMPAAYGEAAYTSTMCLADVMNQIKTMDPNKVSKALDGREFQYLRTPIRIRPCDHVAIQDFFTGKGKPKKDMTEPFDFFEIVGSVGGEDLLRTCAEKGLA